MGEMLRYTNSSSKNAYFKHMLFTRNLCTVHFLRILLTSKSARSRLYATQFFYLKINKKKSITMIAELLLQITKYY